MGSLGGFVGIAPVGGGGGQGPPGPAGTSDGVVTGIAFNKATGRLTLSRSAGLSVLPVDISDLVDDLKEANLDSELLARIAPAIQTSPYYFNRSNDFRVTGQSFTADTWNETSSPVLIASGISTPVFLIHFEYGSVINIEAFAPREYDNLGASVNGGTVDASNAIVMGGGWSIGRESNGTILFANSSNLTGVTVELLEASPGINVNTRDFIRQTEGPGTGNGALELSDSVRRASPTDASHGVIDWYA